MRLHPLLLHLHGDDWEVVQVLQGVDHNKGKVVILEDMNVHGLQRHGHGQEAIVAVDEALQGVDSNGGNYPDSRHHSQVHRGCHCGDGWHRGHRVMAPQWNYFKRGRGHAACLLKIVVVG